MRAQIGQHVEALGFTRVWVAEHHNMPTVTTAATSLVIAHIAAGTTTIRVGAGGIMLPNHAPYVIAEQFGTLETLFPGRIDLGVGRAPGTDQATLRALRRDPSAADHFPQDVLELQAFLAPSAPGQRIEAVPGAGTQVPIWILGLQPVRGAAGCRTGPAVRVRVALRAAAPRRRAVDLSRALQAVAAARRAIRDRRRQHHRRGERRATRRRLATSQQMSFADIVRGMRRLMQPPIDDIDTYWTTEEKFHAAQMLRCSIVGGFETVREGMQALVDRTAADELIVVSDVYDYELRRRSFELIANAGRLVTRPVEASAMRRETRE